MKKLALIAIFGVFASFASAAVGGTTATANVEITVASYLSISFSAGSTLTINVTDGGQSASYTSNSLGFAVLANRAYAVSSSVTQASAGTIAANLTGTSGAAPGGTGTLSATVTGLSLNTAPNTYNGSITLTVAEN